MLSAMKFQVILWGMAQLLVSARRYPVFGATHEAQPWRSSSARRRDRRWVAIRDGK
jgi:hypothetical protein